MGLILHIETTGPVCSVALSNDGKLINTKKSEEANAHGSVLTVLIQELLAENNYKIENLEAVSLSSGPGSYTGLRIGSSTAKGICYALNIPLIAISTLEILKQESESEFTLVLIDARRMDAYAGFYKGSEKIFEKNITMNDDFFKNLKTDYPNFSIVGNIGDKLETIETTKDVNYKDCSIPEASNQVEIAFNKWKNKTFETIDLFTPNYLKTWEEGQKQQR